MRRRQLILSLGGVAAVWPLLARAQPPSLPVIGLLGSESSDAWADRLRAFRQGLNKTGYVEDKNVAIALRWAESRNDRLPDLAADLVRLQVAVIVVLGNTSSALAAQAATSTIPVVFRVAVDPVKLGLVATLNRPGGNLTGVTTLGVEVGPKQLQLLQEFARAPGIIGLLVNPTNPALAEIESRNVLAAARTLGVPVHVVNASVDPDLDAAFARLSRLQAVGLVIGADTFFNRRNERLAALAVRHRMPTISPYREFAAAGGLMSYGGSIALASRQVGVYTGRILNGEKASDLPVQQAAVELIVNAGAAKAIGLTVPESVSDRADEVIE
jgi:putative tryptophan/tyrosine transport system substrate-binding protein